MQKWWDGQESWGSKLSNDMCTSLFRNFGPTGGSAGQSWSGSIAALQDSLRYEW